ncbi:hypothetical protein GW17_00034041, partial [Ensete ventricosum]
VERRCLREDARRIGLLVLGEHKRPGVEGSDQRLRERQHGRGKGRAPWAGTSLPSPCPSTPQSGTAPPTWATTSGGRHKFAPYVAEFADLVLHGCAVDPGDRRRACQASDAELYDAITMSADQRTTLAPFRKKHLSYSYCHDRVRYPANLLQSSLTSS